MALTLDPIELSKSSYRDLLAKFQNSMKYSILENGDKLMLMDSYAHCHPQRRIFGFTDYTSTVTS